MKTTPTADSTESDENQHRQVSRYNLRSNRGVQGLRLDHGMAEPKNSKTYDDHSFMQVECASDLKDPDHTNARDCDVQFLQTASEKLMSTKQIS